jgi:hypothetical protein
MTQIELTDEQKELLMENLVEISASMSRNEAERDLIKARKKTLSEELDIPVKVIARLAKTYHKGNYSQEQTEHQHFAELYESVSG